MTRQKDGGAGNNRTVLRSGTGGLMNADQVETVRLFTAIDLPAEVTDRLLSLCHGMPGARWVKPEQFHLTLRFIGAVSRERYAVIRSRLAAVESGPPVLNLAGVGSFPASGPPRVIWAGVEPSGILTALRNRIEEGLVAAGCEAEERPFSPHITLARLRDVPRHLVLPYLARYASFAAGPVAVTEYLLYSSVLNREGSMHRVEARYPLAAVPGSTASPLSADPCRRGE